MVLDIHIPWYKVAKLPGKPGKVREFGNWPEKSVNFIKLTDIQSSIEQTSHQCWKQIVHNSGLESHTCDFFPNSRKCTNYLLFNSRKSAYRSSDYREILQSLKFLIAKFHKILDCQFWIFRFFDLMVISDKISIHSIIKLA